MYSYEVSIENNNNRQVELLVPAQDGSRTGCPGAGREGQVGAGGEVVSLKYFLAIVEQFPHCVALCWVQEMQQ